jgi:hypothetical protein
MAAVWFNLSPHGREGNFPQRFVNFVHRHRKLGLHFKVLERFRQVGEHCPRKSRRSFAHSCKKFSRHNGVFDYTKAARQASVLTKKQRVLGG